MAGDCRRERGPGFRDLSTLKQRHREDQFWRGAQHFRRFASHCGDGRIEPLPSEIRKSPHELEVGEGVEKLDAIGGRGSVGERASLFKFVPSRRSEQTCAADPFGNWRRRLGLEPSKQFGASGPVLVLMSTIETEFGVAVPRIMIRWFDSKGVLPGGQRILRLAAPEEKTPQPTLRGKESAVALHGAAVLGE